MSHVGFTTLIDTAALDGYFDVLFARADVLHFDGLHKLRRLLFAFGAFRRFACRLFGNFRSSFILSGFFRHDRTPITNAMKAERVKRAMGTVY